jgi:ADP-ribose pyrophosphatase
MTPPNPPSPAIPTITAEHALHKGRKFDFHRLTVQYPSGRTLEREIVRHPGAVVIVPVLPDGRLVLIRVFRIALNRFSTELCAGTLEPRGEDPAACAHRELIEETGYRAANLIPLRPYFTSPGLSDELMHPFVATGLTHVGQHLEDDEHIEVFPASPAQAFALIADGTMNDAKSILALFLAREAGHISPRTP